MWIGTWRLDAHRHHDNGEHNNITHQDSFRLSCPRHQHPHHYQHHDVCFHPRLPPLFIYPVLGLCLALHRGGMTISTTRTTIGMKTRSSNPSYPRRRRTGRPRRPHRRGKRCRRCSPGGLASPTRLATRPCWRRRRRWQLGICCVCRGHDGRARVSLCGGGLCESIRV